MAKFDFNPQKHKKKLLTVIKQLNSFKNLTPNLYTKVLRKHPKSRGNLFTKSEIIAGVRAFISEKDKVSLLRKIQAKPIRTLSGVVPVTLLTKPYSCPGECIFCPLDKNMPKSYLSSEPGAQRAGMNHFDPYNQVITRLNTYYANGHSTDKVELIILGGTWSFYPKTYQNWFIKRCFDALNDFIPNKKIVLKKPITSSKSTLSKLYQSQIKNETAATRCVGLSLETRPDFINIKELTRFRKLGCTKVQIGIQSLDNHVLSLNRRGHTIKATQKAIQLLRLFGFKIQAHWMVNLYGSNPKKDQIDFKKLFSDIHYRPDELKIYPTSLISSTYLYTLYQKKLWQPYTQNQLLNLLVKILPIIPEYCRVSRMIRDFSSDDIISGNKATNLRQLVEQRVIKEKKPIKEIRFREIRQKPINLQGLSLKVVSYQTSTGKEKFIQFIDKNNNIAAFLRLSLPAIKPPLKELNNTAIIREIHVYGQALSINQSASIHFQHLGLGIRLIKKAKTISKKAGFKKLSVISAIGTRPYYRNQGFIDTKLYQQLV